MSKELAKAIERAAQAFTQNPPTDEREDGFESDTLEDHDTHLRKACRALQLGKELLAGDRDALIEDRFYTAAIELAFACIERTSSAILIASGRITSGEQLPHAKLIARSHEAGAWSKGDAERLAELYEQNRSIHYYRRGIPSRTKAQTIVAAAAEFHRLTVSGRFFDPSTCICAT